MTPIGDFLTVMFLTLGFFSILLSLASGILRLGDFIRTRRENNKNK